MRQVSPPLATPDVRQQKRRRLKQLLRACQITIIVIAILMLYMTRFDDAAVFLVTALLLIVVDWAINKGKHKTATSVLLYSLTLMLIVIAWNSSGLHGIITLGFGGILMFAAILANRTQLFILLATMVSFCIAISAVHQFGFKDEIITRTTLSTGLIASSVLIVIAYCAYLMAKDYQIAAANLVTENHRISEALHRIEHLALHDSLTQLPNRTRSETVFNERRANALISHEQIAVLLLDIDNLRSINESLGHHAGDKILCEAAQRLIKISEPYHFLGHFGGDEFVIITSDIRISNHLTDFCQSILKTLSENYRYQELEIFGSVSIGIAIFPRDGQDFGQLLRKADIALHHAKDNGRNNFCFYEDAQDARLLSNLSLISDMRRSLTQGDFHLHYQPKIELSSNTICGFEALLRWQHPTLGNIPPDQFIPIAESSGLIVPLGEWITRSACSQAKQWLDKGLGKFTLAINTSSIQFKRNNFDQTIITALENFQVPPQILELEITESLIVGDDELLKLMLNRLRQKGVHLTIDDFGTGYSNLGYLKKFEVGTLKIDQSFVRRMLDSAEDEIIVKTIIQMCNSLKITCIAEGVEDDATAARLRQLGCNQGQGYLWSRPLPPAEAEDFWRKWSAENLASNS